MEILVDKKPIDFELEGGETLQEVISALNEWTARGNNVIMDLKLNGDPISLDEALTSSRKVEEIETLEMEMQGIEEMALSSLYEARDYLPRLIAGVDETTDLVKLKEFADGLAWIDKIIAKVGSLLKLDYNKICIDEESIEEKRAKLKEVEGLLGQEIRQENIGGATTVLKEKAESILEDWTAVLPQLIEEIPQKVDPQNLLNRLKEISSRIPAISKQIEKVSVDLQTGNEAEAMQQFQGIIDELSDMIHLLREARGSFDLDYQTIKVKDQTVEERSQELDELLSEIITAFENEDVVMLADLLEYELSPLLSRWEEVIVAITAQVENKIN